MTYFSARDRIMAEEKAKQKMVLTKRGKTVKHYATIALWVFVILGAIYLSNVPGLWWTDNPLPVR